ncbi:major capsid protein [Snodgrassella sp. CFCC 13594]|uniref:major capsid protein n=1 Tax=Snodgrassella sp. CFCC 13594 TaxID=1775559 RepID=UPI000832521F|nr:major capsid protein [Snodgrassella sp. CFCC 13594]
MSMKAKLAALGGMLSLATASAMAAVPATVTDAIDGSKADGLEVGWIVVGVVAALFVIGIVKRMIK